MEINDVKSYFWSDKYLGNIELTDEMVANCEQILQVKLPTEYIELLKIQNGGYINTMIIDDIKIDEFFGVYFSEENPSILDSSYLIEEWGLPKNQVIISGDGHTWISLDYYDENNPVVRFTDVEENVSIVLEASFLDFMKRLKPINP